MDLKNCFKMPRASLMRLTRLESVLNNAFACAVLPADTPSDAELQETLQMLGMDPSGVRCVYCGDSWTEWDHFRPIIQKGKPTWYFSHIGNLVPCCGPCNQSKGGKNWRKWITSKARLSPKSRKVAILDQNIARLEAFESRSMALRIEVRNSGSKEQWARYDDNLQRLKQLIRESAVIADELKRAIEGDRQSKTATNTTEQFADAEQGR